MGEFTWQREDRNSNQHRMSHEFFRDSWPSTVNRSDDVFISLNVLRVCKVFFKSQWLWEAKKSTDSTITGLLRHYSRRGRGFVASQAPEWLIMVSGRAWSTWGLSGSNWTLATSDPLGLLLFSFCRLRFVGHKKRNGYISSFSVKAVKCCIGSFCCNTL